MEQTTEYLFRFCMYVALGFTLEIIFAVTGIEKALGYTLSNKRVPKKYLEGWVSLYMIPIHGFGMILGFEPIARAIGDYNIFVRYLLFAVLISGTEALTGFIYDKLTGFYCWDYYADSKYRVFKRGYTLWTLVPLWGIAGLIMEVYSGLLIHVSPAAAAYLKAVLF